MTSFPRVVPLPSIEPWTTPGTFIAKPRAGVAGESFRPMPGLSQPIPEKPPVVEWTQFGLNAGNPLYTREAHRYATLGGNGVVALTTTSVQVLAEPPNRRNFLLMRNSGANPIFVSFGTDANADTAVLYLVPNQIVLFDTVVPQDEVYAATTTGTSSIAIAASNTP